MLLFSSVSGKCGSIDQELQCESGIMPSTNCSLTCLFVVTWMKGPLVYVFQTLSSAWLTTCNLRSVGAKGLTECLDTSKLKVIGLCDLVH